MPRTNRAQHTHTHTHASVHCTARLRIKRQGNNCRAHSQPETTTTTTTTTTREGVCSTIIPWWNNETGACSHYVVPTHRNTPPQTHTHTRRQTINWQKPQVCQQQNQNHRCGLGVDLGGTPAQHIRLPGPFVLVLCVGLTALRECHRPHGVVQEHLEQLARPIRLRSWLHRRNELHLRC